MRLSDKDRIRCKFRRETEQEPEVVEAEVVEDDVIYVEPDPTYNPDDFVPAVVDDDEEPDEDDRMLQFLAWLRSKTYGKGKPRKGAKPKRRRHRPDRPDRDSGVVSHPEVVVTFSDGKTYEFKSFFHAASWFHNMWRRYGR